MATLLRVGAEELLAETMFLGGFLCCSLIALVFPNLSNFASVLTALLVW